MKKKTMIVTIGLGITLIGGTVFAVNSEPGSSNDPLITKSYLEKRLAEQEQTIKNLQQTVANLSGGAADTSSRYEVVTVPTGKSILGKQGSEVIIRSGEGKVIGSAGGGLQDMTDGVDIEDGVAAPRYNLLIIPREDGRGIFAVKELIVMVRGGYTIQ